MTTLKYEMPIGTTWDIISNTISAMLTTLQCEGERQGIKEIHIDSMNTQKNKGTGKTEITIRYQFSNK